MHFIRLIAISILCLSALFGCVKEEKTAPEKPVIVVTTGMIADIVHNIGGDFVQVETLVGPGIDPHSYKARERDVLKIASASLIFYNGLHLEGKLGEILEKAQNTVPSFAVSEYIPEELLLNAISDNPMIKSSIKDPHIWFDPELWVYAVNRVADSFVELDPVNEIYYRKNEDLYIQKILSMHDHITEWLSAIPPEKRVLFTAHDAFAYFGRAYGWEVVGIQGINTANESSIYNIQKLAKFIEERGIDCIFTETSVSTRSVDALTASVAALGVHIKLGGALYSDSIGTADSNAGSYTDMMYYNANVIIQGILEDE